MSQICNLILSKNEEPKIKMKDDPPKLQELKLMNSKCAPRSMDKIIDAIKDSENLQKLSLQKMDLSER